MKKKLCKICKKRETKTLLCDKCFDREENLQMKENGKI